MQIANYQMQASKATDGVWYEIMFAMWQEAVLSDPIASMEDAFIVSCLTWSDFIE